MEIRKLASEFFGTLLLLMAIVGSGIMASNLTRDVALQLLINAISVTLVLLLAINLLGEISGAHFNPVVTLLRRAQGEISSTLTLQYISAQILGAMSGTILANLTFEASPISLSSYERMRYGTFLAEVIATSGLLAIVYLKREKAGILIPAWIGSAYFFTSSTSFANPAVTIGRVFTDTWSGIAISSVSGFIFAQLVGLSLVLIFTRGKQKELRNNE